MEKLKKLKASQVELQTEVGAKELNKIADQVLEEIAQTVEIPGFRKGKAPRLLVIEAVGLSKIRERVMTKAMANALHKLIQAHKLVPISEPAVDIKSFEIASDGSIKKTMSFSAHFDIMPAVKLGNYRAIKFSAKEKAQAKVKPVDDAEVEKIITHLRVRKADLIEPKSIVIDGDWVEVKFEGSIDHVVQEKLCSDRFPLIVGSHTAEPAFEKQLVGMKKDEKKKFRIAVKGYNKLVDFAITLVDHKGMKLPELNSEFAETFGHKTVEELKKSVAGAVTKEREDLAHHAMEDAIIKKLVEKTTTDLPQSLIDRELDRLIGRLRDEVVSKGLQFEDYLAQQKQDIAGLRDKFLTQARYAVMTGLALAEVAKQEKIDTTSPDATHQVLEKLISYALK